MSLTEKDVRHIARLAALQLSDEEVVKALSELNEILGYVDKLQSVSTLGVEPTSHVHGSTNFFREDIIRDSLPVEAVEELAPDFAQSQFRVPKII